MLSLRAAATWVRLPSAAEGEKGSQGLLRNGGTTWTAPRSVSECCSARSALSTPSSSSSPCLMPMQLLVSVGCMRDAFTFPFEGLDGENRGVLRCYVSLSQVQLCCVQLRLPEFDLTTQKVFPLTSLGVHLAVLEQIALADDQRWVVDEGDNPLVLGFRLVVAMNEVVMDYILNLRMLIGLGLALGIEMPLSFPSVHNVDLRFVVLPSLAYSHGVDLE
ncbi:hypothetical protein Taro_014381 [Colocasia esculenta]|uniref:Uncharacterized protein n=1 Tax=Colocasia esculenta TaxID=4460 RepID=A0A843UEK8_COLES|nr:hypothetical protein [Colocasia esculenta]